MHSQRRDCLRIALKWRCSLPYKRLRYSWPKMSAHITGSRWPSRTLLWCSTPSCCLDASLSGMLRVRRRSDIADVIRSYSSLTGLVSRILYELERSFGRVLLVPGDNAVRGVGDEVYHIDNLPGLGIHRRLEPRLLVSDLNDVGQARFVAVLENVFRLHRPVVVLRSSRDKKPQRVRISMPRKKPN